MKKEILDIIKSGNFTIIGTDSDSMSLYKGKVNINKLDDIEPIYEFDLYGQYGYIPEAVSIMAKILGGKTDSF